LTTGGREMAERPNHVQKNVGGVWLWCTVKAYFSSKSWHAFDYWQTIFPSPPIDIWAVMIVWRIRVKIIRTVQCCTTTYVVPQLYTVISTHIWAVLTGVLGTANDFGFVKGFLCVFVCFYLARASLFILCVFGVFPPVCLMLSVLVQVIAWKDSSPKWPIVCRAWRKTLLPHPLPPQE